MKMITNDASELCLYNEGPEKDGRMFNYVLNNKRTRAKLLKGANRGKHLVCESKNGCVNLIFSDGSYFKTVLPLLKSWHKKLNEKIFINETEVQIVEIDAGIDDSQNHIDTKLVIIANKSRLVLHAYNSKQKLMVQGQDYENFALNCLEPFFKDKIEETLEQITKINDDIKMSLDAKKEVKIEKSYSCPQCELISKSNADLKLHIKSCHTKPSICSPPRNKVPKVLSEDLSISTLDEKDLPEIEDSQDQVIKNSQECNCESCGCTFKDENMLRNHFEEEHMEYFRIKYLSDGKQELELDEAHAKVDKDDEPASKDLNDDIQHFEPNIHVIEEKVDKDDIFKENSQKNSTQEHGENCPFCEETFPNLRCLKTHIKTEHLDDTPDDIIAITQDMCTKCSECDFVGSKLEMENHTTTKHENIVKSGKCEQVVPEPFPCELCGLVLATFELLDYHTKSVHRSNQEFCKYCDSKEKNKEDLMEHMIKEHEDIVIVHTMASQVNRVEDKVDSFKEEVMNLFARLLHQNNEMKQELFLIRNNQVIEKQEPPVSGDKEKIEEPSKKSYKDVVESKIRNIRAEVEGHKEASKSNHEIKDEKVLWVGTSISKTLDIHKFQKETKTSIKSVKAFGITREENQLYPETNFTDIVPEVIKNETPDTLVLQGGSIEITNIDVKKALMDPNKDIEEYKEDWFAKVEKDSSNLFAIAERAIKDKPNMKVIIVKRLPRNDPLVSDPIGIKKKISKFGNNAYDQLWFKRGAPKNIHVVNFDLGCEESPHLQKLIFGNPASQQFDGVHLRGNGASRHLTYRAVQAIKPVLNNSVHPSKMYAGSMPLTSHQICPQAIYQQEQHRFKSQAQMHQNTHTGSRIIYNIPTKNSYEVLGNF